MDSDLIRIIKRARENTILEIQIKILREADRLNATGNTEDIYASYGLRMFSDKLQCLMDEKESGWSA